MVVNRIWWEDIRERRDLREVITAGSQSSKNCDRSSSCSVLRDVPAFYKSDVVDQFGSTYSRSEFDDRVRTGLLLRKVLQQPYKQDMKKREHQA